MRLASVAVLFSLLAVPFLGQQPSVRETVEVRLIEVDAVVTDRDGNSITGLTAEDFELFENGKRQAITNFSEYRESAELVEGRPLRPPTVSPVPAAEAAAAPPRTIVFFIDSLHLRGPERAKLFDKLRSLAARTMRPGDRAEVLRWNDQGGVRAATPLTTDRSVIEAAITDAETNANVNAEGPAVSEYAQFFNVMAVAEQAVGGGRDSAAMTAASAGFIAERELAVMRRKTAAMERVVTALAQPAGRSVFVYVSELFPLVAGKRAATPRRVVGDMEGPDALRMRVAYTTRGMLDRVIDAANANGVSLYALKPERPWTSPVGTVGDDAQVFNDPTGGTEAQADNVVLQNEIQSLSLVAEETGGTFGVGPQAADEIVERIVRDVGSYYTLAYRAQSDGSDRTRGIEVRAKDPRYRVRSRKAIVEKSDRTRSRDQLVARLFEHGPIGELPFDVTTGTPIAEGKSRARIPVELSIPAENLRFEPEGTELAARFTVLTVTGASLHTTGQINEQSKRITAPTGSSPKGAIKFNFPLLHDLKPTTVAIAVFDEKSGLAGTRSIVLGNGTASIAGATEQKAAGSWRDAVEQAQREKKPIVVFDKPARHAIEQWLKHPAIQRRLVELVYVIRPADHGAIVLFDRRGEEIARRIDLPRDVNALGSMLDGIIRVKPNLERAASLAEAHGPHEGELELAGALVMLGYPAEARAAVDRASKRGSQQTQEMAIAVRAILDANEGRRDEALKALETLTDTATIDDVRATAWMAIGSIHRGAGAAEEAIRAYTNATEIAAPGSGTLASATASLAALQAAAASAPAGVIRIMPPSGQIVSGRHSIRTNVSSAAVARVVFSIDGRELAAVERPPFSTAIDFGRIPQVRTIRAIAYDVSGKEAGRHELTVNNAGEMFWVRLIEPREGAASGKVRVTATLRAPAARKVNRVVVSWNDAERAVIAAEPWQTDVEIPKELGVLRAVAELDDGRTVEDAVLLNTTGHVEHSDVPFVEIPVTITEDDGVPAQVTPADVVVREGRTQRAIESVIGGTESPLTVGLVFDASGSMNKTMLDVQEAAIRFIETTLGPNDRAFFIAFDTVARLMQTPTSDVGLLRRQIMGMRATGYTALHDAMILGLLQFEGVKGRRALIVFSDGADSASRYDARDVENLARRSNIPIYLITTPDDARRQRGPRMRPMRPNESGNFPIGFDDPAGRSFTDLVGTIRATGGSVHQLKKLSDLAEAYGKIEAALRAQSLVVFRTDPGRSENDWREIDVNVTKRNHDVRGPSGYYAPW